MNNDDREVAQVTHFMKGVGRAMEQPPVPDAQEMWARIQLAERQRLDERARLPVKLAWKFAKYWFVCSAAVIVYLAAPAVGDFFLAVPTYGYVAIAVAVAIALRARRALTGWGA